MSVNRIMMKERRLATNIFFISLQNNIITSLYFACSKEKVTVMADITAFAINNLIEESIVWLDK